MMAYLSHFIECHDNDSSSKALYCPSLFKEVCLSLLEADGVDNALALGALEPRFNDGKVGGINAQRNLWRPHDVM